jgi:hypothetical protein
VTLVSQAQVPVTEPATRRRLALQLQEMPNVGPAMADDLLRLGISRQDDLVGRDAAELYETLCRLDGVRRERSLLDVFTAVIAYAEGGPPTPWWEFTPARLKREADGVRSEE